LFQILVQAFGDLAQAVNQAVQAASDRPSSCAFSCRFKHNCNGFLVSPLHTQPKTVLHRGGNTILPMKGGGGMLGQSQRLAPPHVLPLAVLGEDAQGRERCHSNASVACAPGPGAYMVWGKSTATQQLLQAASHH